MTNEEALNHFKNHEYMTDYSWQDEMSEIAIEALENQIAKKSDEIAKMLAPYDVESIEELIWNVKTKTINDVENILKKTEPNKVAEIKCSDGEIRNKPLITFEKVYEILEQTLVKSLNEVF